MAIVNSIAEEQQRWTYSLRLRYIPILHQHARDHDQLQKLVVSDYTYTMEEDNNFGKGTIAYKPSFTKFRTMG